MTSLYQGPSICGPSICGPFARLVSECQPNTTRTCTKYAYEICITFYYILFLPLFCHELSEVQATHRTNKSRYSKLGTDRGQTFLQTAVAVRPSKQCLRQIWNVVQYIRTRAAQRSAAISLVVLSITCCPFQLKLRLSTRDAYAREKSEIFS